jgi:uncharacterized OsmC-like protein
LKGEDRIREAFERNRRALELRPGLGQGTAVTRIRVREGVTCDITEGPWTLVADMSEKSGGTNLGPNPGIFGRTALGTCLAINYTLWAAHLEFPLAGLAVEVHADYDARGYYDVDDVEPGYVAVRYIVAVETSATEEEVMRFLDEADRHCDYLAVFQRPQDVRRDVRITAPSA